MLSLSAGACSDGDEMRAPATGSGEVAVVTVRTSAADVPVPCSPTVALLLPYPVAAAAYSHSQALLVLLAAGEPAVHLLDPARCTDSSLPLPAPGFSVAVSPDGTAAAVGHDAKVTGLDLVQRRVTRTSVVSATVRPLALDGAGRAYTFDPGMGFDRSRVLTVTLATGDIQSGDMVGATGSLVMHPDGRALYFTSADQTWDDLVRLDVAGPAARIEHARSTFDYDIGGRLFLSEDGKRVFTGTRIVLRASPDNAQDFTFDGLLEGVERVVDLDAPAGADRFAVVAQPADRYASNDLDQVVRLHETRYLNLTARVRMPSLPPAPGDQGPRRLQARRAFVAEDGHSLAVLFQYQTLTAGGGWGVLKVPL
jgi:hypothetical protein